MPKSKFSEINFGYITRIMGVSILLVTMGLCQFNKPEQIKITKELWLTITNATTHVLMFMMLVPKKVKRNNMGDLIKGTIALTIITMTCASVFFELQTNEQWWGIVGVASAFLYSNHESENNINL